MFNVIQATLLSFSYSSQVKQERARKLYEQSLKMYSEQQQSRESTPTHTDGYSSEPSPSCDRPLPTYEQAVQRAEQIKRTSAPEYIRPHSSPTKEAKPANKKDSGKGSGSNQTQTPTSVNSSKDSDKHKKAQRTRRHGHRFSDTRLENARAEKARVTKVARSKSDSSEHINKLAKFQQYSAAAVESTDSEDEWPVVMRTKRISKSVERSPSKEKLTAVDSHHERVSKSAERVVPAVLHSKTEVVSRSKSVGKQPAALDSSSDSPSEPMQHRPRIQSLRHRDWHKELSETYSKVFYQPEEAPRAQFAYVRSTPREEPPSSEAEPARARRRSWVPPVHPTKDLVVVSNPPTNYNKDYTLRSKSSPPKSVVIEEKKSVSLPSSPIKQPSSSSKPHPSSQSHQHKSTPTQPSRPTPSQSSSDRPVSDSDSEGGFTCAEPTGISWSVAKLRNLYDEQQQQQQSEGSTAAHFYTGPDSQPPATTVRRVQRVGGHVREKTNPHAEEAYI